MQTKNNLISTFKEKAEIVSSQVTKHKDSASAYKYFAGFIIEKGYVNIAVPDLSDDELSTLQDLVKGTDVRLINSHLREKANILHVGLTKARNGIAETGTLLIHSDSEDVRIASMMPDVHFVLLKAADIVGQASDVSGKLKSMFSQANNYTAFITGPSRTADIERVLALGAHGPIELHIIIIEGE